MFLSLFQPTMLRLCSVSVVSVQILYHNQPRMNECSEDLPIPSEVFSKPFIQVRWKSKILRRTNMARNLNFSQIYSENNTSWNVELQLDPVQFNFTDVIRKTRLHTYKTNTCQIHMQLPSQHDGPEGGNIHSPVSRIMLMLPISTQGTVFPMPLLVILLLILIATNLPQMQ